MQIDFITYPFTRILDRLLGPCFKTGPKVSQIKPPLIRHTSSLCEQSDALTSLMMVFKIHQTVITGHNMLTRQYTRPYKDLAICSDKLHAGLLMTQYVFCIHQFLMDHGVLLREKCTLYVYSIEFLRLDIWVL